MYTFLISISESFDGIGHILTAVGCYVQMVLDEIFIGAPCDWTNRNK